MQFSIEPSFMRNLWVSSLAWTMLAASLFGQNNLIGRASVAWPNTTGLGSSVLTARVYYPAVQVGENAPVLPSAAGHPVVVLLHGYGMMGGDYGRLGGELASMGIVAVLLNTARFDLAMLGDDAHAMFGAIVAANAEVGGLFKNRLDASRVGLLGHSMGAAVIAYVLNEDPSSPFTNPGYKCALGIAPFNPALAFNNMIVRVPMGLLSGQGDALTPPALHAAPYYASLTPSTGLKFHYQMDSACGHMNVVGLAPDNFEVYQRTKMIVRGFFGQFLSGSVLGMEAILGVDGVSDPHLIAVDVETVVPQSWASSNLTIGTQTRISIAAESGFAGLLAAASIAQPLPTVIGSLLLDPASMFLVTDTYIPGERLDVILSVPPLPQLIGATFAVQGAGATITDPFLLGSAITFVIGS